MIQFFKKYKTGLVLSGGGARGFAHLGAIKCLKENGIEPSIISGVSAGALAAAFYADGYEPEEVVEIFSSKKVSSLLRFALPKLGLVKTRGIKDILSQNLRAKNIEDLKLPIVIAATNYNSGGIEYFSEGNLVDALMASTAIPFLFEAYQIEDHYYLDGGVMDNLPIRPIMHQCKKYIAVHVNPLSQKEKIGNPVHVAERAFHLAIASEVAHTKEHVDIFIEPPQLSEFGMLDIRKALEIFDVGYKHAKEILGK